MSKFDAYQVWLGIPPDRRPLTYYVILGLEPFEDGVEAIRWALQERRDLVEPHLAGSQAEKAKRMMHRLADIEKCLLNPQKKAQYDAQLHRLAQKEQTPPRPTPQTPVKAPPPEPPRPSPPRQEVATSVFPHIETDLEKKKAEEAAKKPALFVPKEKPPAWRFPAMLVGVLVLLLGFGGTLYYLTGGKIRWDAEVAEKSPSLPLLDPEAEQDLELAETPPSPSSSRKDEPSSEEINRTPDPSPMEKPEVSAPELRPTSGRFPGPTRAENYEIDTLTGWLVRREGFTFDLPRELNFVEAGFPIHHFAVDPTGTWAVGASEENLIACWDLTKRERVRTWEMQNEAVLAIALPKKDLLLVWGKAYGIQAVHPLTGSPLYTVLPREFLAGAMPERGLAITSGGSYLALFHQERNETRFYSVERGVPLGRVPIEENRELLGQGFTLDGEFLVRLLSSVPQRDRYEIEWIDLNSGQRRSEDGVLTRAGEVPYARLRGLLQFAEAGREELFYLGNKALFNAGDGRLICSVTQPPLVLAPFQNRELWTARPDGKTRVSPILNEKLTANLFSYLQRRPLPQLHPLEPIGLQVEIPLDADKDASAMSAPLLTAMQERFVLNGMTVGSAKNVLLLEYQENESSPLKEVAYREADSPRILVESLETPLKRFSIEMKLSIHSNVLDQTIWQLRFRMPSRIILSTPPEDRSPAGWQEAWSVAARQSALDWIRQAQWPYFISQGIFDRYVLPEKKVFWSEEAPQFYPESEE
ncbi:Hypothetical protein PBC10988_27250 [Planctomycetales bacterium 10988]|nr:Hypothetical protein PBC10988_27250 [Planctomycetales bacterium 10988]